MNRRELIVTGGLGAALTPDKGRAASAPTQWAGTADVVVAGSGAAAYAAALTARSVGSSVLMLEKASLIGGTTARSGGTYWIPNNTLMRQAGLDAPKPWAMRLMVRLSYPTLYDPNAERLGLSHLEYGLIETFYDRGSEAIDHLGEIGAIATSFSGAGSPGLSAAHGPISEPGALTWPDYHADLPENNVLYGRHLTSSPNGGGAALVSQLKRRADILGIPLLLNHAVTNVFRNSESAVVGVGVQSQGAK